ncbi:MAG: alkaline phosphatase family protein [Candidatus Tumulicola sp.]
MPSKFASLTACFAALVLAACGAQPDIGTSVPVAGALPSVRHDAGPGSLIKHVIIIIQENRTPDNLFQGLPGADIASSGLNSHNQTIQLHPVLLEANYDPNHLHSSFLLDYAGGAMNGFNLEPMSGQCHRGKCAYGYVPRYEVVPYFDLATQYAFADRMFGTNQGPSFPAHQYFISGTSTTAPGGPLRAADNPYRPGGGQGGGGCDAPLSELVATIDASGFEGNPTYPCFDRPTLGDLLDARGATWRYYEMSHGSGLWYAYDAIRHIRYGNDYANVVTPSQLILNDISHGTLSNVSWVVPPGSASDHSGRNSTGGPAWVSSIVNAVGASQYWNDCAIFIVWDDWGGWYDHVKPPVYNSYELGIRVPLIVVSPYAKRGYVSHTQYEFGSILKFTEAAFKTGSLNTTDARANSLDDVFKFSRPQRPFVRIKAPPLRVDPTVPDTD